jgi:microcystin-dependent protein
VTDGLARHTPTLLGNKIIRAMSIDVALLPSVGGALSDLAESFQWLEVGSTVEDVVASLMGSVASWYAPMNVGQISFFVGSLPDGWLAMDGSTYDEIDHPELYAMIGSPFKDVINETFTLPDMGGLFPLVADDSFVLGAVGGFVSVALSIDELPAHTHDYTFPVQGVDIGSAGPPLPSVSSVTPGTPTGSTGSGNSHENMPPYVALIAGVFSGRV